MICHVTRPALDNANANASKLLSAPIGEPAFAFIFDLLNLGPVYDVEGNARDLHIYLSPRNVLLRQPYALARSSLVTDCLQLFFLSDFNKHARDKSKQLVERVKSRRLVSSNMFDPTLKSSGRDISFGSELDNERRLVLPFLHQWKIRSNTYSKS